MDLCWWTHFRETCTGSHASAWFHLSRDSCSWHVEFSYPRRVDISRASDVVAIRLWYWTAWVSLPRFRGNCHDVFLDGGMRTVFWVISIDWDHGINNLLCSSRCWVPDSIRAFSPFNLLEHQTFCIHPWPSSLPERRRFLCLTVMHLVCWKILCLKDRFLN